MIYTSERDADGVSVSDNSNSTINRSSIATSGSNSDGISVSGKSSTSVIRGTTVQSTGWNADGVSLRDGAGALILGSTISTGDSGRHRQDWRLGATAGAATGSVNVSHRSSSADVDNYGLSIYGGNRWQAGIGHLNLLVGGGYTRHNISSRRDVNVDDNETLKADYHGSTWQAFTDLGYSIPLGIASTLEPYVNTVWLNQHTDAFDETGGNAALHGSSSDATHIGLNAHHEKVAQALAILENHLGYSVAGTSPSIWLITW
jgi:transcription elongation factor